MRSKTLFPLLMLSSCLAQAQQKPKDATPELVSKGTFFLGLNTNLSMGFAATENRIISQPIVNPKAGYFIFDRLSVGVSYRGQVWRTPLPNSRLQMLHSAETDLNYFFYARKNILMYAQAGLAFGRYNQAAFFPRRSSFAQLKVGGGIQYRFAKHPDLGLNLEANYYMGTGPMNRFRRFPTITVGFVYSFNRKKNHDQKRQLLEP